MTDGGYNPRIAFDASPTCYRFLQDSSFVTGITGPLGSGKSVTSVAKAGKVACEQAPDTDGYRKTRGLVIRNTYPELLSTTINTWKEVFDEAHCGPIHYSHPITHHIVRPPEGDTPGIDMEVLFLALDKPGDIRHLKSLDATWAWVNEASEVPFEVVDMLTGRVGRYPPKEPVPATWAGIFMDTNATDDQNWWHRVAEMKGGPDLTAVNIDGTVLDLSWSFYQQPPAALEVSDEGGTVKCIEPGYQDMDCEGVPVLGAGGRLWVVNPAAENLKYLRKGYYHQQITNKSLEWIQRFMQAKHVYMVDGKAWVPEYSDQMMARSLTVNPDLPLIGGIDCGGGTLNPAAVIGQRGLYGDWRTLSELSVFDVGINRFSEMLHAHLAQKYPGLALPTFYLDPAARTRDEVYEIAVQEHLRSRGFKVMLAPTNDPVTRRDALALPMSRLIRLENGNTIPGFLVDKDCVTLRAALAGKWHRKRMNVGGLERYTDRPEKNAFSHVGDASGYMCMAGGEHAILTRNRKPSDQKAWGAGQQSFNTDFDVFS
jgi:hypothetical protein